MDEFLQGVGVFALIALVIGVILIVAKSHSDDITYYEQLLKDSGMRDEFMGYVESVRKSGNYYSDYKFLKRFFSQGNREAEDLKAREQRKEWKKQDEDNYYKNCILDRQFAYKHEKTIFSIFSPLATRKDGKWVIETYKSIKAVYFRRQLTIVLGITEGDAYLLIDELKEHRCIEGRDSYSIGPTLTRDANIISEKDYNMDSWIRDNGFSMTKEELLYDIESLKVIEMPNYTRIYSTQKPPEDSKVNSFFHNNHVCVDLGLSVNWSSFNIGATKVDEYGDFFAWGETNTKEQYIWENYKYRISGNTRNTIKLSKYQIPIDNEEICLQTILEPEDDAAHINWGGNWRMPTKKDVDELFDNCIGEWVQIKGVKGLLLSSEVKGYTDRFIFIPTAGIFSDELEDRGTHGYFWHSNHGSHDSSSACMSYFDLEDTYAGEMSFFIGLSVRPVCPK